MDISRLLIANRGEIAVRIARTAHRLGMSTVGVYSEPDANALHVDSVDVAVALGGATPAESYLRGDAIIAAALAAARRWASFELTPETVSAKVQQLG